MPEPETPVTQTNFPTGNSTSMPFRLCSRRPAPETPPVVLRCAAPARRSGAAREELARDRPRFAHHLAAGALGDDLAAVLARARPHVDELVGGAHHLLVVLDDEHGVAEVAEPLERRDQPPVVALVEADRRLVEDVEDADELRADLRREPDALRLAARERRGGAVELEVADADVVEEREPLPDLLQDPAPISSSVGVSSSRRGTRAPG